MTPNKKSTLSICAYDTAQFYDLMPTLPYCELYDKLLLFKGIGRVACYRFYTFISFDPHKRLLDFYPKLFCFISRSEASKQCGINIVCHFICSISTSLTLLVFKWFQSIIE